MSLANAKEQLLAAVLDGWFRPITLFFSVVLCVTKKR